MIMKNKPIFEFDVHQFMADFAFLADICSHEQTCQDQTIFYEQVNGVYVDGRKDATLTTC